MANNVEAENMAINFEAANMAGYNNPQIEIVTLATDNEGNYTNPPTYEILSKILRRGAVPFLAIIDAARTMYYVLPLSYYSSGLITFSCITQSSTSQGSRIAEFISVKFVPDTGSPIFTRFPVNPGK